MKAQHNPPDYSAPSTQCALCGDIAGTWQNHGNLTTGNHWHIRAGSGVDSGRACAKCGVIVERLQALKDGKLCGYVSPDGARITEWKGETLAYVLGSPAADRNGRATYYAKVNGWEFVGRGRRGECITLICRALRPRT